jgi:hypothetical protein
MVDELSVRSSAAPATNCGGTGTAARDFATVYRAELVPLIRFVMKHGARPQEAADAAQEAFVQAYKTWEHDQLSGTLVADRGAQNLLPGRVEGEGRSSR